ncbi:hypothetical protein ACOMHN_000809 [Nucella lapillus]
MYPTRYRVNNKKGQQIIIIPQSCLQQAAGQTRYWPTPTALDIMLHGTLWSEDTMLHGTLWSEDTMLHGTLWSEDTMLHGTLGV